MITVWDTPILATVEEVVRTLKADVVSQGIPLLQTCQVAHNNIMVTCPAHGDGQEQHPSCGIATVDVRRGDRLHPAGTAHCFRCGYTADLPAFISMVLGYQDQGMRGFRWLAARFANVEVEMRRDLKLDMGRVHEAGPVAAPVAPEALDRYRYTHPYMYQRALTDKVIDYFDVGYDAKARTLTFPVKDLEGTVRLIQRRAVEGKTFDNDTDAFKSEYVYGLYEVWLNRGRFTEVFICESILDALAGWSAGRPAVALMGNQPSLTQIKMLKAAPVRQYINGMDNDLGGRDGWAKLQKALGKNKLLSRVVWPPGAKDLNEVAQRFGLDAVAGLATSLL